MLTFRQNETRTRTALIDPLLRVLGWDVSEPGLVTPEYSVQGKWADYALLDASGKPAVLVEAKKLGETLSAHQMQMVNYAVASGVPYAGLSNGDRWELYRVFDPKPLEDKLILDMSIAKMPAHECALKVLMLWRPNLQSGQPIQADDPILPSGEALPPAPQTPAPTRGPYSRFWMDADYESS